MGKKKVALLNFPLDNNYGGNLQRYALMEVLRQLGCDVVHLSTRFCFCGDISLWKKSKSLIKYTLRPFLLDYPIPAWIRQRNYQRELKKILPFYEKYVPHTPPICNYDELKTYQDYDVYVVGSDQVWRRSMCGHYPYSSMFFDFVEKHVSKKIAYGISLGTETNELNDDDLKMVTPLFREFSAVSVREDFALELFEKYRWNNPKAIRVLDPTLLLKKDHYDFIINHSRTRQKKGIFCYVLDMDDEKRLEIDSIVKKRYARLYFCNLSNHSVKVEQWLRNIKDADFVITDSYHGMLFSLIYNKPFYLLTNQRRGNGRLQNVLSLLKLNGKDDNYNWEDINLVIDKEKYRSIEFIKNALNL